MKEALDVILKTAAEKSSKYVLAVAAFIARTQGSH